jgi:hypothetical protein
MEMGTTELYFNDFLVSTKSNDERYYLPVLFEVESNNKATELNALVLEHLYNIFAEVVPSTIVKYYDSTSTNLIELSEGGTLFRIYSINLKTKKKNLLDDGSVRISFSPKIVPQNLQNLLLHNVKYHIEQAALLTTKVHDKNELNKDFLLLQIVQ